MRFTSLQIQRLRCFSCYDLLPGPRVNLIHGPNGSGKTSLLEALYLSAFGRSFLTPRATDLLKRGAADLRVECRVEDILGYGPALVTMRKTRTETDIRFDGQPIASASSLATYMPVLAVNSRAPDLLSDNPSNRRALIDRSLFHVKPSYVDSWKQYRHALRQRNEVLLQRGSNEETAYWEQVLASVANSIDDQRLRLVDVLNERLSRHQIPAMETNELRFQYSPGWHREEGLADQLRKGRQRDIALGYTFSGPHRADLSLFMDGQASARRLSRGQSKMIVCLIIATVARFIKVESARTPVLLLDDLAAEMDDDMIRHAVTTIGELETQCFFTAIKPSDLRRFLPDDTSVFHVERNLH